MQTLHFPSIEVRFFEVRFFEVNFFPQKLKFRRDKKNVKKQDFRRKNVKKRLEVIKM